MTAVLSMNQAFYDRELNNDDWQNRNIRLRYMKQVEASLKEGISRISL